MSLDQLNVIDVAGISKADDAAVLTLFDSWDWSEEHEHLLALQEKFNCYFGIYRNRASLRRLPSGAESEIEN